MHATSKTVSIQANLHGMKINPPLMTLASISTCFKENETFSICEKATAAEVEINTISIKLGCWMLTTRSSLILQLKKKMLKLIYSLLCE